MNPIHMLGLAHPIIQAPMAGVSTPEMAAAVSNAGALGSIAVGAVDALAARTMIEAVRQRTERPFNVNLFVHAPAKPQPAVERDWIEALAPLFADYGAQPPPSLRKIYRSFVEDDAMLDMLVDARPAVVSFHFGLPDGRKIDRLKAAGCLLLANATIWMKHGQPRRRASMPWWRRVLRLVAIAGCSILMRPTMAWGPWR